MAKRQELLALGANCVGLVSNDIGPQCPGHRRRDDCRSVQARNQRCR